RVFERKLRPKLSGRGQACVGVKLRCSITLLVAHFLEASWLRCSKWRLTFHSSFEEWWVEVFSAAGIVQGHDG
ncbi:hypothetical protein PJN26_29635, partial [Mycobacterium kansasii]